MGDVERLAKVLAGGEPADWEYALFARRLLASDWLVAHDAKVAADARREALREAADEWEGARRRESFTGVVAPWADVCQFLRDRADREAASHTPESAGQDVDEWRTS